jgi:hypothetical protein
MALQSPRDQLPAIVRAPGIGCPKLPGNPEQRHRPVTNVDDFLARIGQVGNPAHANESGHLAFGFHFPPPPVVC